MGKIIGIPAALLSWTLALPLLAVSACAQTDAAGKRFDIPAQSAGSGLNEFARQADITLIFSYDLVADDRTQALKGRYTVDHGLATLLDGTLLAYRQGADGTYLICLEDACGTFSGSQEEISPSDPKKNMPADSGNASPARLHD